MLWDGAYIEEKRFERICTYIINSTYNIFDYLYIYIKSNF